MCIKVKNLNRGCQGNMGYISYTITIEDRNRFIYTKGLFIWITSPSHIG